MNSAEYIVRFKGDYSALAKDLTAIGAATKKLEDDEVVIKLHYDGNIKEFNKVFDKISNMHPELGIQFQYNVNQKILEEELGKLRKLSEIKLDVDNGDVLIKLNKMVDNVEHSLQKGLSEELIEEQVRDVFKYYNTAIDAGAKKIDIDSATNRLYDVLDLKGKKFRDLYDNIFDQNINKPLKLFEIDGSIDSEIQKAETRVNDIKAVLEDLENRGASKNGLPTEMEKLQDEIKILRANIGEMQEQLKNLSGEPFSQMTEQIKATNEQLDYTLQKFDKIQKILSRNGIKEINTIGGVVRQWQEDEVTQTNERYTAYNSKTKQTSGAHLAADAEGTSMKLMRSAIQELGDEADGIIHSHPFKYAAFSDDDIDIFFKLWKDTQGKIWSHAATTTDEAISIDMSKVDISKQEDILKTIRQQYYEIDEKIKGNIGNRANYIKESAIAVLDSIESKSPILNDLASGIKSGLDGMFEKLGDSFSLEEYQDAFDELQHGITEALSQKYSSSMGISPDSLYKKVYTAFSPVMGEIENILFDSLNDESQQAYQQVLKKVFSNPDFLKFGETSAIKVQALSDFIDWGSIEDSAEEAAKKGAKALQKAQDSNSPAELTKPLGKDFGLGYAEGIREAMPEIVAACKEIVLGAYNAVKEASNDTDVYSNTGSVDDFVNSFKASLEKSIPNIQEKIKEVFSNIELGGEDGVFSDFGWKFANALTKEIDKGFDEQYNKDSFTKSIEILLNQAFERVVLDTAVRLLIENIQTSLDDMTSLNPIQIRYFEAETDSLIFEIEGALENHTFNVNLGGTIKDLSTALNTSADNVRQTFVDAVKWMREANEWQKVNEQVTHERQLFFNSKTGEFSNPTVSGDESNVGYALSHKILDNAKKKGIVFDTDLHWHGDFDTAAPSPQDIIFDFSNVFDDGISKFVVGAQKELTEIDFSKIAKDRKELASKIKDSIFEDLYGFIDHFKYRLREEGVSQINAQEAGEQLQDSLLKMDDEDILVWYGKYLAAELNSEWENLKDYFKEQAINNIDLNSRPFDFDKLKDNKTNIEMMLSNFDLIDDNQIETEFGHLNDDESGFDVSIFVKRFINELIYEVQKGIDYTAFDGTLSSVREVVENSFDNTDLFGANDVLDKSGFYDYREFIINRTSDYLNNVINSIQNLLPKSEENDAFQKAGKQALYNIIKGTPLEDAVRTYSHSEFEQKYGKPLSNVMSQGDINNGSNNQIPFSPTLPSDFQQQLQTKINESGEYIVKICGELVEEFKSRLQTAIDETGIYHVDVEGWLVDGFHDRLQRDIDGDEKYVVEVKGKLVETFKEVLQEAIDGLGAFPIEVKPYMRKGREIEEVDLPGNDDNSSLSTTILSQIDEITQAEEIQTNEVKVSSPTQEFDNTLQKDLVYLENYKNTIEEINKLKRQPQTGETEKKIQELQKLADYFFGSISITQTEWGNDGGNFVDQYSLNYKSSLRTKGYGDAVDEIWNIGRNKDKLNVKALTSEFTGIDEEISRIESKSEELRQQFVKDLTESRNYVKELTSEFQDFVVLTNDVKTERSPSMIDVYNADIDLMLKKFPVLEQFRDKFTSRQEAKEFVKTDEWMDFLAALPEAHKYLESIGYDFDKINEVSEEAATPASADATTSALLSKKEVVEQLRAELKLTKKAAEELFDAQGFDKTNGKYQIEQQAVDKLIASLKEKKEVEETQDVTTPTSPVVNAMQSEAEVVDRVVENEKQKFDELKNKISKTIPKAIETKNKAFEKEGKLVAKIVDDEITYFEVLKDSVDEVTESVNKQQNTVKDSKPDNKKSKEKSKKKDDSTQPEEVNAGRLFYQVHKSEFDSLGKKSDVLKDMAKYYADLEKSSAKAYSDAEQKANGLINKIDKLRSSGKYTQDFVNELNNAENELKIFLSQLKNGAIPFDELDNKVTILANKIEKTLSQKAFGSVKLAAEKSLTNVGLKIDQLVAKNSAMGKEFETRFANLRSELDSAKTVKDVSRIIAEVNKLESELINAGKTGRSFIDQIKQRLRDINSKYIAQYFSFQDIIRYARQAAQSIIQLNDAFIELSKVSNTSLKALEADFQSYADIAENIGGTITDTISATADWARFNKIDPLYGNV